ncbi:MAG: DUF3450 domain-containing protein [Gammaproteobacteria bacterium]|nr:DUF3450 domain-containing protein [Gammaproteobacteria bacterium]
MSKFKVRLKMGTFVRTFFKKGILRNSLVGIVLFAFLPLSTWADTLDDIINSGIARQKAAAASQKRIDAVSEQTEKIIANYEQERKVVDGLKVYNDRLQRTLTAQEIAMGKLEKSIDDASLIERQIVPLMLRMIEGLDRFIAADIPFKLEQREARVERIRGYLTNANISAAERFRQVLEAYSIENNYGTSIDVYTDTLSLAAGELTVNILQVGRTGLYYQTLDGAASGYYDKTDGAWKDLDSSHNEGITQAIRITQGKESKGLMKLPVAAPEVM